MEENRITIEPGKLGWLAAGMSEDQILADYPEMQRADFPAVFDYAACVGRRVAL